MEIDFYKTHAYGNDYLLVDCVFKNSLGPEDFPMIAKSMCRRRTGVGASGVVFMTRGNERPVRIICYNSRGLKIRFRFDPILCASRYLFDTGFADKEKILLETPENPVDVQVIDSNNFRISLGEPRELKNGTPLIDSPDREYARKIVVEGRGYVLTPLHLGNPLLVHISDGSADVPIRALGRTIRSSYPEYRNAIPVEVFVLSREEIETGSVRLSSRIDSLGIAASAMVASVLHRFTDREVTVLYHGYQLFVQWLRRDNNVYVTGTGRYVFAGTFYTEETELS
jgi:diaminopimelate epimerase